MAREAFARERPGRKKRGVAGGAHKKRNSGRTRCTRHSAQYTRTGVLLRTITHSTPCNGSERRTTVEGTSTGLALESVWTPDAGRLPNRNHCWQHTVQYCMYVSTARRPRLYRVRRTYWHSSAIPVAAPVARYQTQSSTSPGTRTAPAG